MKNLLAFLIVSLSLFSCSSDDDSSSLDKMVGAWKITSFTINGTSQSIDDMCNLKGLFTFINGGTYTEQLYSSSTSGCSLTNTIGGTWTKSGSAYKVTINTPNTTSNLPNTTFTPSFANDQNSFTVTQSITGVTAIYTFTRQ